LGQKRAKEGKQFSNPIAIETEAHKSLLIHTCHT